MAALEALRSLGRAPPAVGTWAQEGYRGGKARNLAPTRRPCSEEDQGRQPVGLFIDLEPVLDGFA